MRPVVNFVGSRTERWVASIKCTDSDMTRHAKFIAEAWKHPETLKLISKIAGINLVPVMDYELGHINISVEQSGATTVHEEDQPPVVGWHRDSYPFVCVLMMSDTKGMRGGETALKQHNGEIIRVRGPDKVVVYVPSLELC